MKRKEKKHHGSLKKEYVIIETADKIRVQYKIATPVLRAASFMMDFILFIAVIYGLAIFLDYLDFFNFLGKVIDYKLHEALTWFFWFVIIFLLRWFYYFFFEMLFNGKTPGKMILGLRVINHDGRYLDLTAVVLRNFVRIFDQDVTFYLGALISIMANREYRRIGDLIAGTIVIKEDKLQKKIPDFSIIKNWTPDTEEKSRKIIRKLSEDDLYVLRKFLNSVESFPPGKRKVLVDNMARTIRVKIGDPDDYVDPLDYLKTVYMRHNDEY